MEKQIVKQENDILFFDNNDYVDLSRLNKKKSLYDWKNSIGKKIVVFCNNVTYELLILEYKAKQTVVVQVGDIVKEYKTGNIMKCQFSNSLNMTYHDYKYSIGEVVNGLKVLKQTRLKNYYGHNVKAYEVACESDGYIQVKKETDLDRKRGCPVCRGLVCIKGINDVGTTHHDMVKYFLNKEDAYKNTYGAGCYVDFKCPDCGYVKNMQINTFTSRGFSCDCCSDGSTYPNKFMTSVLRELSVEFISELSRRTFDWCNNYRYDFYLPDYKLIIEMDGGFHNKVHGKSNKTLEEIIETDRIKDEMAHGNGIYVMRINCEYGHNKREATILQNVLNSNLRFLFDFENINWNNCIKNALKSNVIKTCELYTENKSVQEIMDELKISKTTVTDYLMIGNKIGLIKYNK